MFVNLMVMILRRNRGERFLNEGNMVGAKGQIELIGKVMVPLNIALGVLAIFLGTFLSSSL